MRRYLLWMVICLALSATLEAQQAHPSLGNSDRMFFPSDMFWGYGQFDLAPPHNEIDPNLCRSDAGKFGGVNAPCNAFARTYRRHCIRGHSARLGWSSHGEEESI